MLRRGRHTLASRNLAAAMPDLELYLRHDVSTRSGAAAAIIARPLVLLFADGPNAHGVIRTGLPRMIRAVVGAQRLTRSFASTHT